MDLNHDGHVTKAELLIYYDAHDLNNDAKVTSTEYYHHVDLVYTDPQVHSYLRRVFPGLDIDNNGVLNNADYDDMFAICDFNRNGMITVDEYQIYFRIIAT
ncbi:uncharacterized protein LOC131947724 [Physella acuta]|uniref:uncharacterized protein LOC131947724 n=1 Tax=Physella acuta TaxID=109671 RepID=UPI0027DDCC4E|nr:uncharacterized protein LOC131947724 [Physella acuta]